jgi:outer membrane protein assembly factor BamB
MGGGDILSNNPNGCVDKWGWCAGGCGNVTYWGFRDCIKGAFSFFNPYSFQFSPIKLKPINIKLTAGVLNTTNIQEQRYSFEFSKLFDLTEPSSTVDFRNISSQVYLNPQTRIPYYSTGFKCPKPYVYDQNTKLYNLITSSQNNNHCNKELTQTIFNYLPRPLRVYILKYLVKMNDIFNEKMNTKNDLNGSNGVITYDIPGFNSLDTKLLNQIAQTFYVNNNGSVSIQKIYDALTIGKTIVDVRCDIAVHADPTRLTNEIEKLRLQYENDMTQSYMTQSEVDTLVNRYLDKLNTLYQIQYENIESIQLNSLLRIYLDNNQNVTGYYKEVNVDAPIVALSFNPLYNGGIPVSVDNSYGGRLASYKPLVSFTKNVGVWGGPRDEATLRRVMRDYELQILSDLSGEYINVDNNYDPIGSERIYVDEVNAVADITTPAPSTPTNPPDLTKNPYTKQIIIQWKQSKYNIITNELITGSRRTFIARFAYVLNTYNWYSNQYVFDASGFKFADYNDGNTENTICSSDDPSYSCDPSDTNPPKFRGGVVAGSTVAGELGTTDGSPQFTVKTGGTTSYPLSTTFDSAKYSTTYPNTIKLTSLTTPIKIMRPLPNDTDNLDNASGECSSVVADTDCTSSAILYKLMTYYNTLENRDPSKSGAIVRITKAVTPSAYQCDVEVEMDYSQNLPAVGSPPTTGLQKETRSFSVALNLTTCDHYVVDVSGVNSGLFILPNTPALFPPAAYAELVLDDANRDDTFVPESMKGTVEKAVNLIKEYREETAETSGRLYTLQGCPNATNRENVCASPEIMDQFAASYKTLYPGTPYDIGRIIRANTVNSTTCDYVFERNRFLDNNKSVLLSKSILGARVNFLTSACAIQSIKEVLPTATWQEIQNVDGSAAPLFTGSYTPTGRMIQGEGDTAVYWLRSDTFEKSFIKNAATPFTSNSGPSVQPDTIPGLEMWYEFDKFTTGSSSLASSLTTGGASLSFPSGQTFSSVMSITLKSKKLLRVTKSQSIFFPFTKTYTDYTITILSRQTGGQNQSVLVSNVNNNSKYTFGYDAGKKNVVFSKGANGTIGALYDKNYTPPVSNTEWDFYTFTRESLSPVQTGTTPGIMTVYRNGSKLYSGRADSLLSSLGINSSGIDGYSSDCEVAEFLFYNRVLYKNEIQSVEEYLGSKWLVRSTGTSEISIGSYTSAQGRFDSAVTKSDMYDSLTMTPGTINDPSTPLVVVTSQQTGEEKLVFPGVAWFDASILPQQSYTNGTLFPSRFSSTDSTYKLHSNFEHIYNGGFTMTSGTVGYTKLNGLPILTLSSRQSLKMTALVEPLSSWTLMYVARHYGNGPYGTVFQSVNTNSVYGLSANKYTYKMNDLNFVTITGPQPEPSNTNWVLVTITCTNEADFNMYWNGTLKNSGSLANQTNADGIDGTYFDGVSINTINTSNTDSIDVQRANCEIAEFLIYNRAVTDKERLQVEGYLISKWGLLNIWSTQSYDESKVPSSNMVARFDASTLTKGSYVSTDAIPYSTGSNFTIRGNPNVKSYMLNMKSVLNLRPSDGLSMKANTAGYTSWTFTYLARHTGDNVSFSTATNVGLDTNAQWPLQGQNINHTARSISSPSTTFTPYPDSACTSYLENWSFPTESSTDRFASPILTQDRIYLMNTNYVYAIDKSTGSRIWKFTSLDGSRMFGSGVLNSNGTLLYGCTYYGSLCAINTSNGTLNWSYTIPNADKSTVNVPAPWNDFPQKTNFITSGLAIDSNGVLYFGSYNSYVYAVRAPTSGTTGVLAWKYKTNAAIDRCTPAVDVDNTIYIGSYDKTLYALRAPAATATGAAATTGVLVWKFECQNQNVSSSISIGTFMIRATATATPTATKVILFGTSCSTTGVATSYVYAVKAPASGTTALEVWKFQTYHYVRSTPLIGSDGNVYFGSWDWSLYCINGTDGTLKWSYPTNEYLDVNPAIGKNGMIYVGGYGTLYALKAPPSTATGTAARTGVVGWTYKIPTNGFLGSPAIDTTGNLYVGTALDVDGALYSINTCTIANYGTLFTGVGTIGTTQLSQTTILGHYCPDTTVSNNSYKKVLKYATGANITTDTTERNDTSWALVTISYDGTTHNMWWNGAQVVTNVANTSLVAKAFQGVGVNDVTNTSSLNSNSEIAEFFVYSRAITNDERTNLESYITKKWGLNAASASASASASTTTTQVSRTIPQMLSSGGLFWMDGSLSSFSSQFTGTSSLQFTATGSPVFQTDSTSNRKILNFTTTQKVSVPISLGENNKSFTLLFVTRQSGTNKDRVFQGVTQPNIFGYSSGYKGTFNKSYSSMTGESPWFGNPNRWKRSNTDWDLFTMQFDGVSNVGAIYMNGAQIAYERVPTQNQIIFDGLSINKSNPSDCQLAEVIVYNRVITDMERIQLEGYLQAKWRVGALTVPDQISGGLMWMDASVYDADLTKNTTLTNINIVRSQFLVTSSNYAMKGESIVKQNVLNGLPVFGFSTSQYISLPLSTPLTSWTVTVVCRQIGGQNQPILTSTNGWQTKNTGDSYSQNVILGYWNGFKKYILINDSLLSQRIDADSQWDLITVTYEHRSSNGSVINAWWNGVQITNSTHTGAIRLNGLAINLQQDINDRADCEVAELLLYNRVITNAERLSLEAYLNKKWGLTPDAIPEPATCEALENTAILTTIDRVPASFIDALPNGPDFTCDMTKINYATSGDFIYDISGGSTAQLYWRPNGSPVKYKVTDANMKCPNGIIPNHSRVGVTKEFLNKLSLQNAPFSCVMMSRRYTLEGQFLTTDQIRFYWIPKNRVVKYTVPSTITSITDGTPILDLSLQVTSDILDAIPPAISTDPSSEVLTFSNNMISLDYIPGDSVTYDIQSEIYREDPISNQAIQSLPELGIVDCAPKNGDTKTLMPYIDEPTLNMVNTYMNKNVDVKNTLQNVFGVSGADMDVEYMGVDISSNAYMFKLDDQYDSSIQDRTFGIQMYTKTSCDLPTEIAGHDIYPSFSYAEQEPSTKKYKKLRLRIYKTRDITSPIVMLNKIKFYDENYKVIPSSTYSIASVSLSNGARNWIYTLGTDSNGNYTYGTNWLEEKISNWKYSNLLVYFNDPLPFVYGFSFITANELLDNATNNRYVDAENYPISSADADPLRWKLDGSNNDKVWTT